MCVLRRLARRNDATGPAPVWAMRVGRTGPGPAARGAHRGAGPPRLSCCAARPDRDKPVTSAQRLIVVELAIRAAGTVERDLVIDSQKGAPAVAVSALPRIAGTRRRWDAIRRDRRSQGRKMPGGATTSGRRDGSRAIPRPARAWRPVASSCRNVRANYRERVIGRGAPVPRRVYRHESASHFWAMLGRRQGGAKLARPPRM